jgi:hypothetical protein
LNRELRPKEIWLDTENDNLGTEGDDNDPVVPTFISIPAMAYQPALDSTNNNFDTVYGSDGTHNQLRETVVALETKQGNPKWQTTVAEGPTSEDGSNVITDDTHWGPATVASNGYGVYVASGPVVQAYDSITGALLWTYQLTDTNGRFLTEEVEEIKNDSRISELIDGDILSRMEIVDGQSVLVAAHGSILRLRTVPDGAPTLPPEPTTPPIIFSDSPTPSPTLTPNPTTTGSDPNQSATSAPSSSSSASTIMLRSQRYLLIFVVPVHYLSYLVSLGCLIIIL